MLRWSFSSLSGAGVRKPISHWLKHKEFIVSHSWKLKGSFKHLRIQGLKGMNKVLVCYSPFSAFDYISFILGLHKAAPQLWALPLWEQDGCSSSSHPFSMFQFLAGLALQCVNLAKLNYVSQSSLHWIFLVRVDHKRNPWKIWEIPVEK